MKREYCNCNCSRSHICCVVLLLVTARGVESGFCTIKRVSERRGEERVEEEEEEEN